MTGSELKSIFEEIIDDSVSSEMFVTLIENADDELRGERDWAFLKDRLSITRAAGDTYETAHALPVTFDRVSLDTEAVRSDRTTYRQIPFDSQEDYKDSDGYYYFKYNISSEVWEIYFTGTAASTETVKIAHQKRGTEMTVDNHEDATVVWPGRKGAYLAWLAASRVSGGIDGDEINFRMSEYQERTLRVMHQALVSWDAKIRLRAMGGATPIRRDRPVIGDNQIDLRGPSIQ